MKLIGVESFLDGSKIIFYFVSKAGWISGPWSRTWLAPSRPASKCARWECATRPR